MKQIIKIISLITLTVSIMEFSGVGIADTVQENADLARINNLLNAVYPLITDAENQALPNTRLQFRYDWLRSDIQAIQAGIAEKINQVAIEPRIVQPLQLQYVEQENKHKEQDVLSKEKQ